MNARQGHAGGNAALMEYLPETSAFAESWLPQIGRTLESVLHFTDLNGNESILFVLPNHVADVLGYAAELCAAVPEHVVPLVLRRRELFQLAIPYAGPRQSAGSRPTQMMRGTLHCAAWAKYRSAVLHGRDIRAEIPFPARHASALQHHLEISSSIIRYCVVLDGLTRRRSVLKDLECVMNELMLSVLLLEGRPCWTLEEIVREFRENAAPELCGILQSWTNLKAEYPGPMNGYCESYEFRAVWLYEQFLGAVRDILGSVRDQSSVNGPLSGRFQLKSEIARWAGSDASTSGRLRSENADLSRFCFNANEKGPYFEAVEGGLRELNGIQEYIRSLVLYGSAARNAMRPGQSDILDAYLVLDDICFRDEARFLQVVEAMANSCRRMAQGSVPFHPYTYLSETDWRYRCAPSFLSEWQSDSLSCVLFGEDIRPFAGSSSDGLLWWRRSIFTLPLIVRRCSRYLAKRELNKNEMLIMLRVLSTGLKLVPRSLCATCSVWLGNNAARQRVPDLVPNLDLSVLDKIDRLRGEGYSGLDVSELQNLLRSLLEFLEQATEAALGWLARNGQLESVLDI